MLLPLVLLMLPALAPDDAATGPTKPSLVALDFRDRPLPEIAAAIASRSGNPVVLQFYNGPEDNAKKLTLISQVPVPFWEAIDRLCLETKTQRTLNEPAGFGARQPNVSLFGPGPDPGPACYSGPIRFGNFTLHAEFRKRFAPVALSVRDNDGYRAEFEAWPEPKVLAIRTGPLEKLEAIDDQGKSLLDPAVTEPERISAPPGSYGLGPFQTLVRVNLGKPASGSTRLKVLRGVMPLEIGVAPKVATKTLVLAESVGKTIKVADLALTVEEVTTLPGSTNLKLLAKIDGPRGPGPSVSKPLAWARSSMIQKYLEVVDAQGRVLTGVSGGFSAGDELRFNYSFSNNRLPGQNGGTPNALRIYAPDWVKWNAPFEFADVPLP